MSKLAACFFCAMLMPRALAADPAPAPTPAAPPVCKLFVRVALDMEMDSTGRITVPVSLNGTQKRMMLDTGAAETLIAANTVAELKLEQRRAAHGAYMIGYGGNIGDKTVTLAEFGLGDMKGKDFTIFVLNENFDSAGLLGADILRGFDLDFDFANARLRLIAPNDCSAKAYWTSGTYGVVPFEIDGNHILVRMKLDGENVSAILDTGAADTVMSLERAANSFDLDRQKLKRSRHYPFKTLAFGDVAVGNPAIELAPDQESGVLGRHGSNLHMIVGMGVLRRLHLYIDYKHKLIYVTPATQY